jgi:hypothetical protein
LGFWIGGIASGFAFRYDPIGRSIPLYNRQNTLNPKSVIQNLKSTKDYHWMMTLSLTQCMNDNHDNTFLDTNGAVVYNILIRVEILKIYVN